jgi:8-oxo-dGTP diphosphatase
MDIPCVGAVCINDGTLLLIQRGQPPAQGMWSLPGGRVEPGESAVDAVVREVREETGLDVRVIREVGTVVRDAPGGNRYVIEDFLVAMTRDSEPRAGDDASDVGFFDADAMAQLPLTTGLLTALADWGVWPTR